MEIVPKVGMKKVRETTGTTDKKLAQEIHDKRKQQLRDGLNEKPTWDNAVERWMREKSDKRSLDRDKEIATWLTKFWHGKLLAAISDVDVKKAMELKKEATTASTANHYLAFTKSLFNIAKKEWKWIDRPLEVCKYKVDNSRVRFLTENELGRLMKELPPHLQSMVEFSIMTGLRQANVAFLKWANVDLQRRMVWIDASEYKNKRMHGVPLNDRAAEVIEAQLGKHETYVFTLNGKPVGRPNNTAWKKALDRAGIKDFRWHDLRHTFASYHAMNGTPLLTLKQLGGWRSLEMVTKYAHLSAESTRQWAGNSSMTVGK